MADQSYNQRIPTPDEAAGDEPDEETAPDDEREEREADVETAAPTRGGSNVPNAGKDPDEGRRE